MNKTLTLLAVVIASAATSFAGSEIQRRSYPNSFGGQYQLKGYELIEELDLLGHAPLIAEQAVAQALGQNPNEKTQRPKMTKSPGKQHEAGVGQFQYGKLADMQNSVWNVILPPKDR